MDADGDGWRDMPDGSELNVLITPQYNKTRQALYLRIAEVLKTNLEAVGVQTTMDEESVRNSDHATEVRKQAPMSSTSAIPLPAWPCMTPLHVHDRG